MRKSLNSNREEFRRMALEAQPVVVEVLPRLEFVPAVKVEVDPEERFEELAADMDVKYDAGLMADILGVLVPECGREAPHCGSLVSLRMSAQCLSKASQSACRFSASRIKARASP